MFCTRPWEARWQCSCWCKLGTHSFTLSRDAGMNRRFLLTLAFALASPSFGHACTREEMQIAKTNLVAAMSEVESDLNLYAPSPHHLFNPFIGENEAIEFNAKIVSKTARMKNHAAVQSYRKAMAEFNRCAKKRRETTLPPLPPRKPE